MNKKLTMIYWKSEKFWLGKLLEHPEIMTQGETLGELEENLKDAYLLMAMDDVPFVPVVWGVKADIAQAIYDLRKQAGLSREQLADLVGATESIIGDLEEADYEGDFLGI